MLEIISSFPGKDIWEILKPENACKPQSCFSLGAPYCPCDRSPLQGLEVAFLAEYENQGYTNQYGQCTPVYSDFWMTRVEYISKEVRYPSYEKVECDFLRVLKMQTGYPLSPQVILI